MHTNDFPLIRPEEALDIVLNNVPDWPSRRIPIDDALRLVLAEKITSPRPIPEHPTATVDGFAVISSDDSPKRRIVGEQLAGHFSPELSVSPGEAVRITTGALLPKGADAVIMLEDVEESDGEIRLVKKVRSGENLRQVGQDVAEGEEVLPAGTLIGPAEIGLMASLGFTSVNAYPRPTVAILSTGDEVKPLGTALGPGEVWDSNRHALLALVSAIGAEGLDMGLAPDDELKLRRLLRVALSKADVVVTTGGASAGKKDLLKPILSEWGTIHFGRVFQKPGKPFTFATVWGKPVFTLPGNPVSSMVSFELYIRPFLYKMLHRRLWRPHVQAVVQENVKHASDRIEFVRARVRKEKSGYVAVTTGLQGSARISSLVGANALLRIPPSDEPLPAGSVVEAILLDCESLEVTDV
jgi:molybdenum cofactor synthesis domain-containing protein